MNRVEIRPADESDDFQEYVDLMSESFGMRGNEPVLPQHMFSAFEHSNCLFGAYNGNKKLVGFAYLWPNIDDKEKLYLHAVGVLPDYQGENIGTDILLYLRQYALDRRFNQMRWTYHPLKLKLGNFYISKLGGKIIDYKKDTYGNVQANAVSDGTPSDRFVVNWELDSDRVTRLLNKTHDNKRATLPSNVNLLELEYKGMSEARSIVQQSIRHSEPVAVQISQEFSKTDTIEIKLKIIQKLRDVIPRLISTGYYGKTFHIMNDDDSRVGVYIFDQDDETAN